MIRFTKENARMKHLNLHSGFVNATQPLQLLRDGFQFHSQDRANHEQEQWGTVKKKKQVKAGRALSDKVDKVHMVAEDPNLSGKAESLLRM